MIGIIDYDAGNLASVANALKSLSAEFCITDNPAVLEKMDGIILPGVGAAPGAMRSLREKGLVEALRQNQKPLLGICLGMQLLFDYSEEGKTECLGLLPGMIRMLDERAQKIPHMGWNSISIQAKKSSLLQGVETGDYFYFAHSYYLEAKEQSFLLAVTDCGNSLASVIGNKNIFGFQFHPEKSATIGLQLLRNFVSLCTSFQPSTSIKTAASA